MEATVDVKPVAEPSAATPVQYDGWDEEGTPIVTKKSEPQLKTQESAPADAPKVEKPEPKGENAAESGTAPKQEQKPAGHKLSADERIKQLLADNKRLLSELETERTRPREPAPKPAEAKAESKPAKPATFEDWRKDFKPKAWVEKYIDEHKCDYEDAIAAMSDHVDGIRTQYRQEAANLQAIADRVKSQTEEATKLYPDFKDKAKPIFESLTSDKAIHPVFKEAIGNSPVFPHLVYALSNEQSRALLETAKTNVVLALKQLGVLEDAVMKELAKGKESGEPKAEKKEPPAEPKPRAPKPPAEVGGRGTSEEDPSIAAARSGDFTAFDRAEKAKMARKFARA